MLTTVLDFMKSAIGNWWTEAHPVRKLGDVLVAVVIIKVLVPDLTAEVLKGYTAYVHRDAIAEYQASRMLEPQLNRQLAANEAEAVFARMRDLGALAVYVRAIDMDANVRGPIVAAAMLPEMAARIEELRGEADSTLIGTGGLDHHAHAAIIEGRPHWVTPTILIVPAPTQFRAAKKGLVVVFVREGIMLEHRATLENRAMAWSDRIAGVRR